MRLTKLLNELEVIQVIGKPEIKDINAITHDSRNVNANDLFVAVKGFKTDGHNYIPEILNRQPGAVVVEDNSKYPDDIFIHAGCVKILVENSRRALAKISDVFYDHPSQNLKMIGITGTKGKTTTSYFIKNILKTAGYKVGLIGTIANYIDDDLVETKLTTPESHDINRLLSTMVNKGCTHCVIEVSSHSLALDRVTYLDFDYAVFTNITSDHFDFHHDFDSYLSVKKILFDNLKSGAAAVINYDDNNFIKIISECKAKITGYGTGENFDYLIRNVEYDIHGTRFEIKHKTFSKEFSTSLIGRFNSYNAAAAISVGNLIGIDSDTLAFGIKSTPQVPGRFEVISSKEKKVIIDYSHTTDSLREALTAIQHLNKNISPVHTVFGCGGDRDKVKRPQMGKVADELSTEIYVTSDNPRSEDPELIINDILKGVKRPQPHVIVNREDAIKKAVCESEPDAIVLIAGKGHENYQEINGVRYHFSDKEIAQKYLQVCEG